MNKFLLILVLLGLCSCENRKYRSGREGDTIPSIDLLMLDSASVISTKSIAGDFPVVLLFFEPYCEYCHKETESILKSIREFGSTQFYFVSVSPLKDVRNFYTGFQLKKYSNIHIGIDTAGTYMRYFRTVTVPHTSIYTKKGKLVQVFPSEVDAATILSVIKSDKI